MSKDTRDRIILMAALILAVLVFAYIGLNTVCPERVDPPLQAPSEHLFTPIPTLRP